MLFYDEISMSLYFWSLYCFSYLYPDIDKDEMLKFFDSEERYKSESPTGYIQSEIVMVAKTG